VALVLDQCQWCNPHFPCADGVAVGNLWHARKVFSPLTLDSLPRPSPKFILIAATVAAFLLFTDQISKSAIITNYSPNELIASTPYLSLVFVTNPGGICGYAQGAGTLLAGVGILTVVFIIVSILFFMPDSPVYAVAFGMLFAGATGNLIDRLRFGYVVDFITFDLLQWPSFNLADASIVGGIGLIGFLTALEMMGQGGDAGAGIMEDDRKFGLNFNQSALVYLILAGLVFAVAYLFCVYRPF
jgi:signal peptidase II